MRYDTTFGWVMTRKEFLSCGFAEHQYKDGKRYKDLITTNRGCKSNPVEIIVASLAPRFKSVVEKHFVQLKKDHVETMDVAQTEGENMTEVAVAVTSNTLEVNAPYIKVELEEYVRKNHTLYIPYYLQAYSLNKESIIGYAKICALGMWVYGMSTRINAKCASQRDRNRNMRSFRANILEALDLIDADFFEIKIPRSSQKFDSWIESIVAGLDEGRVITELVVVKRQGNVNSSVINKEQGHVIMRLYRDGAALSLMEIYNKMVEVGRVCQWWRNKDTGLYEPPSYGTIRNYVNENKNIHSLERTSGADWINDIVPTINREYPKLKNQAWGVDGTAQNENVKYKGKVRQYAYAIKVFDYATFRLLNIKITLGMDEKASTIIDAIKGAIKECGYKPNILQCDHGPGYEGLKEWCESEGIKCIPAALGLARAKPIERLIGMVDTLVDKFNKGWTGGNRTALGVNSHPSENYVKETSRNARSFEVARQNIKRETMDEWNHYIISEREGKQCLKTPTELWNELESDTPKLEYVQLAILTGKKHTKKLTIDGLCIQNDLINYTYFPAINTAADVDKAYEVFAKIPRIGHQEASQLDIYIHEYGKPAPVFKGNKYWGMWTIKPRAEMFAAVTGKMAVYSKFRDFQNLFSERAKTEIAEDKAAFDELPIADIVNKEADKALSGRKRIVPLLDKANLNAEEFMEKAGIESVDPSEDYNDEIKQDEETKQFYNPTTGELINYKQNKK